MFKNCLVAAAASLLALVPQPAAAQRLILPGALLLAGYRATCGPVDTMIQPINDIAAAYTGRIILHPRVLNLPRAQQLFWYTHECAHQIFGPGEAAADCWAVQQGKIQGWLTSAELSALGASMRAFPGDANHADGPSRLAAMNSCYAR
ncbi:hypothetical protein FSB78_06980 [Sphingomonas ginsenosidivorax]|uniref:Uncharacterized protein n=1 Tax=Sphingomonas ginsenosidivorax TaxID=862135 RepID=A0A5C6UD14_9SPHN|nr:hypothetical protein [Sphingomonas ginsenosidivorax]TXC70707.1 hypothetical protein FSB78_06980 [Sphingomonas ginsenosidivorax]